MNIRERFAGKLSSGKWFITVVTTLVFAYLSIKGTLATDKVMEVVLIVIYAYFTKQPTGGTNGGSGDNK